MAPSFGIDDQVRQLGQTVERWAARRRDAPLPDDDIHRRVADDLVFLLDEVGLDQALWHKDDFDGRAGLFVATALAEVAAVDPSLAAMLACRWAVASTVKRPLTGRFEALEAEPGRPVALVPPILPRGGADGVPDTTGRVCQAAFEQRGGERRLVGRDLRGLGGTGLDGADLAVVCGDGDGRFALALVSTQNDGVDRGPRRRQVGLDRCPEVTVDLNGARAASDAVVGLSGHDLLRLQARLAVGAAAVCSGALCGGAEILEAWVRDRVIKGRGQPMLHNPLCAAVLAGVARSALCCRADALAAVRSMDGGQVDPTPADGQGQVWAALSLAGRACHEAGMALGRALELMGSAGYAREWRIEGLWRDVRAVNGWLGSRPLSEVALARALFGSEGSP